MQFEMSFIFQIVEELNPRIQLNIMYKFMYGKYIGTSVFEHPCIHAIRFSTIKNDL